jgi:hypothetical protein
VMSSDDLRFKDGHFEERERSKNGAKEQGVHVLNPSPVL